MLILVQKPGKPIGPLTSLRPIVLLSVLRKTLSLIVLSRIALKVDDNLSSSQSGFRRGRSTADVVFDYRWLCAKEQRHRVTVEFLGIDLSRAFDTIRRDKLLVTLQTFLDEYELQMIRFLLADTSLQPRLSKGDCMAFATTIGTPRDLARNEEFSKIAVINIFFTVLKTKTQLSVGRGSCGENFEISHAIDM